MWGLCPAKLCMKSVCGNGARISISRRIRLTRVQRLAWALVEARNRRGAGEGAASGIGAGSRIRCPSPDTIRTGTRARNNGAGIRCGVLTRTCIDGIGSGADTALGRHH